MPTLTGIVSISQLLTAFSEQVVEQQEILDEDYRQRLQAFGAIWQDAQELGCESLAREFIPSAMVINQAEMRAQIRFATSKEQDFALGIGLGVLNLGFQRRYAHSEYAQSTLQIIVQRFPFPPNEGR
jgi:hypothetical protein